MANEEHLDILRQGINAWIGWREENPHLTPDLSGARLDGMVFHRISDTDSIPVNVVYDLRRVDLSGATLIGANLAFTDLSDASLIGANLKAANFATGVLNRAFLGGERGTILRGADLSGTNLTRADLQHANLTDTDLRNACFSETRVGGTMFGSTDLSTAVGLDSVRHAGPSVIGIDTLYQSRGRIPERFLRGCDLGDADIEYAKLVTVGLSNAEISDITYRIYHLKATQAIQISPLFISYSHADGSFVDNMEKQLNEKGIRFWRDVHHATAGRLEKQIDRAMRLNPTVLLILSEHSVNSDWVEHEAASARELEKKLKRDVLCPVGLDDSWKTCTWPMVLRRQIMDYNILDFSNWQDRQAFARQFNKLIEGLRIFYK